MNQTKVNASVVFKKILLILSLATASVVLFVFVLSFCLQKVSHYENLYFLVPYIISAFASFSIALFVKIFGKSDLFLVLISTLIFAFVFLSIGIFSQISKGNLLAVLIRQVVFIALSFVFSVILTKSKKKKSSKGKFKFGK